MSNCAGVGTGRDEDTGQTADTSSVSSNYRKVHNDDVLFRRKDGSLLDDHAERLIYEALHAIATIVRVHGGSKGSETAIVHVEAVMAMHTPPIGPGVVLKRAITQQPNHQTKDGDQLNDPRRWGRL